MRYIRILLLQMETVFQERGRAFIWFLMSAMNPLILILFWKGAAGNRMIAPGWNFSSLVSYYFLLTIIFSLLVTHNEEDVARIDIKEGNLVAHLTKPFTYYWKKFLEEIPYRILQSFYGFIVCFIFYLIFGKQFFVITNNPSVLGLTIFIMILALFISFTMRMIMGISAFWFTDSRGIFEAIYATEFALGGTLLPLVLLPPIVATSAYILPFSYIVYFPLIALQGKLGIPELFQVIGAQIAWITLLGLLYHILWIRGVRRFSGVGQ